MIRWSGLRVEPCVRISEFERSHRTRGAGSSMITIDTTALFAPFSLSTLTLRNRIVMAPMTRNHSAGGVPGDDVVGYYRRRAEHGVGLIVTEGTAIAHPAAVSDPRVPRFHGDDALAGWARVAAS